MFKLRRSSRPPTSAPARPAAVARSSAAQPLVDLAPGTRGRVCAIHAPGDNAERLKVMGVCVGRKIAVITRGDPMIVCVWGTRIGISARLAHQVMIDPCPQDTPPHPPRSRHHHHRPLDN